MAVNRSLPSILKSFRPIAKGDNVHGVASSDRMSAIQDAIKLLARGDHINAGVGIRKKVGQDGLAMLSVDQERKFQQTGLGHFPWEITVAQTGAADDHTADVRVRPGTVNGALPSNMFDTFNITTNPGDTYYIVLDITTDGIEVTDVTISADTTPPDPIGSQLGFPPSYFELLIGVTVGVVPFQLIRNLLFIFPAVSILTPKSAPVLGAPFYDVNYTWAVSAL